jgi:phenylalanyl-tRNA synthetase alpha chain
MALTLPPHQHALLAALAGQPQDCTVETLALAAGLDQSLIMAAATELGQAGLVAIEESSFTELRLGPQGEDIARGTAELPERVLARAVRLRGGQANLKDLSEDAALAEAGVVPGKYGRQLAALGWAEFDKGALALADAVREGEPPACAIEAAITMIAVAGGAQILDPTARTSLNEALELCKGRKELLSARERSRRSLALTEAGAVLAQQVLSGEAGVRVEANELTPELLADGAWRNVQFRPYDVTLAAETLAPGKPHPLVRIVEETRQAFFALGFAEAACPMAEIAFWDFDALFQPQDHPAREMQDTFYMKQPSRFPLPTPEWVDAVKAVHEHGGATGSRGWRYNWSEQRAAQVVLRTHMTASSIEAIARNPRAPQKIFSIGKVFRRETVDDKHLPEFFQVDGIIIDEHASLASLLGTLAKFYERMGIPAVRFKPDFFPYTEPSVGVEVQMNGRWLEMGGAGIFRPEVLAPFGCSAPVLAWGLGLERLAMVRFGVGKIRQLVQSDFDWLKASPLAG